MLIQYGLASHADLSQGKSLSLICAALTWLRTHKSSQNEVSLDSLGPGLEDEPAWIVEQTLQRRRDDLTRQWEEREKKLESIRLKEQTEEIRSAKRRRVNQGRQSSSAKQADEDEDEWLLDEPDDSGAPDDDALSGLNKQTRDILLRFGLGSFKSDDQDDAALDDGVKVRHPPRSVCQGPLVTSVDILHIKNTFTALTVRLRVTETELSFFAAALPPIRSCSGQGVREASAPVIKAEAMHQPSCRTFGLAICHQ